MDFLYDDGEWGIDITGGPPIIHFNCPDPDSDLGQIVNEPGQSYEGNFSDPWKCTECGKECPDKVKVTFNLIYE